MCSDVEAKLSGKKKENTAAEPDFLLPCSLFFPPSDVFLLASLIEP